MDVSAESSFINRVHNQVVNIDPHLNFFVASQSASGVNIDKSTLKCWVESKCREAFERSSKIDGFLNEALSGGVVKRRSDLERVVVFEKAT
jgi:hypothetical protein